MLKKISIHPFLFIPYICYIILSNNYKEVNIDMSYRSLFYGFILTSILFFIHSILLKDRVKSALLTTFALLTFFTYGISYECIEKLYYKGLLNLTHIHRYLIIIYLSIYLFVFYLLYQYKKKLNSIDYAFNILFIFLLFYNVFIYVYKKKTHLSDSHKIHNKYSITKSSKNQNIYYFILDGYANSNILKKHLNYDNSYFINSLKDKGFLIIDTSYANYYFTSQSLKSTLNFDVWSKKTIHDNTFFSLLKQNEYEINVIKSGYSVTGYFDKADNLYRPDGLNEFERSIIRFTIFRLDELLGFSIYYRLKSQIKSIDKFVFKPNQKKFLFFHIVSPHPPYVFNKDGSKNNNFISNENNWEPIINYTNQLEYISNEMLNKISNIISKDTNAIIILQSDHGPFVRLKDSNKSFESRAMILNGIYAPKELQENYKKNNTSVNSLIHLSNYMFNANIPIQRDTLIGKKEFFNSIDYKNKISTK